MLSNTATPKYYGQFRDAVLRGEIVVNKEISEEMNRIDALIANPNVYYDPEPTECWISFCENEMTLTDGSDVKLLFTFKLWAESIYGWYFFQEKTVPVPSADHRSIRYIKKREKKRLINKQYLIVSRSNAK